MRMPKPNGIVSKRGDDGKHNRNAYEGNGKGIPEGAKGDEYENKKTMIIKGGDANDTINSVVALGG